MAPLHGLMDDTTPPGGLLCWDLGSVLVFWGCPNQKHLQLGGLNNRIVLCPSSGRGQESEIPGLAGWVPSEGREGESIPQFITSVMPGAHRWYPPWVFTSSSLVRLSLCPKNPLLLRPPQPKRP